MNEKPSEEFIARQRDCVLVPCAVDDEDQVMDEADYDTGDDADG